MAMLPAAQRRRRCTRCGAVPSHMWPQGVRTFCHCVRQEHPLEDELWQHACLQANMLSYPVPNLFQLMASALHTASRSCLLSVPSSGPAAARMRMPAGHPLDGQLLLGCSLPVSCLFTQSVSRLMLSGCDGGRAAAGVGPGRCGAAWRPGHPAAAERLGRARGRAGAHAAAHI